MTRFANIFIVITVVAVSLFVQEGAARSANISGKVTNTSDAAISGALVKLEDGGQTATTGVDGSFTLATVGIHDQINQSPPYKLSVTINHGLLCVNLAEKSPIEIITYTIRGKAISAIKKTMDAGIHSIALPSNGAGVYLYKIKSGRSEFVLKGNSIGGVSQGTAVSAQGSSSPAALAKQTMVTEEFNDTIVVNKTGYAEYRMPINNSDTSGIVIKMDSTTSAIIFLSTLDLNIAESTSDVAEPVYITNSATDDDYKPTYSKDGSKVAFFRAIDYGSGPYKEWKTKLCAINVDGTGFKELTKGDYADFNPMWTRDGSDKITFSRIDISTNPATSNVYWTNPDSEPGQEQRISDPNKNDFVYSGLEDGRLLVRGDNNSYYLMTPSTTETPLYEELSYPFPGTYLHKMSISPSETKITYMKVVDTSVPTENGSIIAYADFDANTLEMKNEVEVSEIDVLVTHWYPCWTKDENTIVYAIHPDKTTGDLGFIVAYSILDGTTTKISGSETMNYRYPNVKGVIK